MIQSSALATQIAQNGAARVRQGEMPELKKAKELDGFLAQQNLDYFAEGFRELQARDNADGIASIHIFNAGPDEDPATGKVQIGNLQAEFEGDTRNGTRYSVEDRGDVEKIKSYRFEETKVVVYEATIRPNNEVNTNVLILDRQNPEKSLIGVASSDWLLS
jgi:hypothetical protein